MFAAMLTGALHEDGLADCADGFGAGVDRARTLEIMSDSRIGTYGTLAIIFSVGLKWMGLATMTPQGACMAIIVGHTIARAAIIPAMAFSRYAKPEGLGKMVDGPLPLHVLWITLAFSIVVSFLFAGWAGLVAVFVAYLSAGAVLMYLNSKIGGYTGDGLGAMEQVAEVTVVLVLAGIWA